jgi:hypothetical protein
VVGGIALDDGGMRNSEAKLKEGELENETEMQKTLEVVRAVKIMLQEVNTPELKELRLQITNEIQKRLKEECRKKNRAYLKERRKKRGREKLKKKKNEHINREQVEKKRQFEIKEIINKDGITMEEAQVVYDLRMHISDTDINTIEKIERAMQEEEGIEFTALVMDGIPTTKRANAIIREVEEEMKCCRCIHLEKEIYTLGVNIVQQCRLDKNWHNPNDEACDKIEKNEVDDTTAQ